MASHTAQVLKKCFFFFLSTNSFEWRIQAKTIPGHYLADRFKKVMHSREPQSNELAEI